MKKIIISLSIIAAVAAIVVGATTAFFSDTETSSDNTFTAGAIDLKVDNHCYYNEGECVCNGDVCEWVGGPNAGETCFCSWDEKDLAQGDLFFNFADLKPGDHGEDTISLHVRDNDAWACAAIKITKNDDATGYDGDIDCTEPELEDGDDCNNPAEPDNDLFDGELAQNLQFFFWADVCDRCDAEPGDNVYQPDCDKFLMSGFASDIIEQGGKAVYALADSEENNIGGDPGDPLKGSSTYYIGKMWCFGEIEFDADGNITGCNGVNVDNKPQTDEVQGDIEFYAVQQRNNGSFTCEGL